MAIDYIDGEAGNGFIGLNPSRAKRNIEDFRDAAGRACYDMKTVFAKLAEGLSDNWASPQAVEFSKIYNHEVAELVNKIGLDIEKVISSACDAYNLVANANGETCISVDSDINMPAVDIKQLREKTVNGTVGMAIQKVEELLDEFRNNKRDLDNEFNSLPKAIALYDNENGMTQYYSTRVSSLAKVINESSDAVEENIIRYIEVEKMAIEKAKDLATKMFK